MPDAPQEPRSTGLAWVLRAPFDRTVAALDPILTGEAAARAAGVLAIATVAAWYLYVPIHELLHAAGCAGTGGTVTTLEIQEQYGGALLARVFSFVVPGGEYAGRLSGFDTHGSDAVYLATDALPFALSAALGPLLLRVAARRRRPITAAAGFVLGLAPFVNLPGDYFEMGSILVTRPLSEPFRALRSDDLIHLAGELAQDPAAIGLANDAVAAWSVVLAAVLAGLALAYATWWLGEAVARAVLGRDEGSR